MQRWPWRLERGYLERSQSYECYGVQARRGDLVTCHHPWRLSPVRGWSRSHRPWRPEGHLLEFLIMEATEDGKTDLCRDEVHGHVCVWTTRSRQHVTYLPTHGVLFKFQGSSWSSLLQGAREGSTSARHRSSSVRGAKSGLSEPYSSKELPEEPWQRRH